MYRPRPGYPIEYDPPVLEIQGVPTPDNGQAASENGRRDR